MPILPKVGVVWHDGDPHVEALLADFAADLRGQGIDVAGLCQRKFDVGRRKPRIELFNLRTGQAYLISQNLGASSQSCVMDPGGMAEASAALRAEIERGPALLVVNKFGCLETQGGGLVEDLFEAIARDIPVLTSLAARHQAEWTEMTGGVGTMLTADKAALWAWWNGLAKDGAA